MYDPMYQFFKLKGFPVGLDAVAKGLRIGMNKTMNDARFSPAHAWRGGGRVLVGSVCAGESRLG